MNAPAAQSDPANAAARRVLCLAASILGLLVLTFGVAPGTVLASSATDVYTEQPPPVTPPKNNNNGGNNNGGKVADPGNTKSTGNGDSGSTGTASTGTGASSDGTGSAGDGSRSGKNSKSGQKKANGSDKKSGSKDKKAGNDGSDDSTIAATTAGGGGGDDGGSSALPIIIAILIGVPLIGAGAYYGWTRYRVRDDETKDRLKSALKGEGGKPTGTS